MVLGPRGICYKYVAHSRGLVYNNSNPSDDHFDQDQQKTIVKILTDRQGLSDIFNVQFYCPVALYFMIWLIGQIVYRRNFFFKSTFLLPFFACNRLVDKIKAFMKWIRRWEKNQVEQNTIWTYLIMKFRLK